MKKKFSKILGIGLTLALLVSLLLTAAPVSAVSTPVVTLTAGDTGVPPTDPAGVISKLNVYKALFTVGTTVPNTGQIVVVFEAGTNIDAIATNDVQIISTQGIGGGTYAGTENPVVSVSGAYPAQQTLTITLDGIDAIGAGAMVQITIGTIDTVRCVVNPTTDGTRTLTVATQTAVPVVLEAAVTSTAYTITIPTISPVPGVVKGYNANDIKLYEKTGATAINDAFAVSGVTKVVVGPGTYDEDVLLTVATVTSITSLDGATTTIISNADAGVTGGTVTLSVKTTFDGFTVVGRTFGVKVDSVAGTTVQNCVLSGATAGALDIDVGTTALPTISMGNTITVATADHGINVATPATVVATSTNDIFTVAGTGTGIINNGTLTLTGATISGASGIGFQSAVTAAVSTITGTAFSGLDTAILVTDGTTVAVSSSIITGCGRAAVISPAVTALPAIDVALVATSVTIIGNTIADCVDEILQVATAADSSKVFLNFNTITNPAKGIDNNDTAAVTLDATNNLWDGGVAPTVTMAPYSATAGMIDTTPYLIAAASNPKLAVAPATATLTGKTTAGVNVSVATALGAVSVPAVIGVANYASNPGTTGISGTVLKYFDVYVGGPALSTDVVTISLFGTVSSNTEAWVWGAGLGKWVLASDQAVNVFAGSVTITAKAGFTPSLTDLAGLPLALVEPPVGALTAPDIISPDRGERDIPLTPTFSWTQIPAAAGYYFELADNANFVTPLVKLDGDLGRLIVTAYAYVTELPYSTAYYWRVKAVSGTIDAGDLAQSPWNTGVFITMDEPEEPIPPVVVTETPAPIIVIEETPAPVIKIEPIVEVITPPATPITPAWIYVIIGVGAVLVIALIVLVVRTRRVA